MQAGVWTPLASRVLGVLSEGREYPHVYSNRLSLHTVDFPFFELSLPVVVGILTFSRNNTHTHMHGMQTFYTQAYFIQATTVASDPFY